MSEQDFSAWEEGGRLHCASCGTLLAEGYQAIEPPKPKEPVGYRAGGELHCGACGGKLTSTDWTHAGDLTCPHCKLLVDTVHRQQMADMRKDFEEFDAEVRVKMGSTDVWKGAEVVDKEGKAIGKLESIKHERGAMVLTVETLKDTSYRAQVRIGFAGKCAVDQEPHGWVTEAEEVAVGVVDLSLGSHLPQDACISITPRTPARDGWQRIFTADRGSGKAGSFIRVDSWEAEVPKATEKDGERIVFDPGRQVRARSDFDLVVRFPGQ